MSESLGGTVEVNGVVGHKFKDTDPPIYLLPDGRFAMRYGGLWKVRGSIAPLLKMLGRHNAAVKLMRVNRFYAPTVDQPCRPEVIEVVSWERGVLGLKDGQRRSKRYNRWYLFDEHLTLSLVSIDAERHKLELAHAKAVAKLVKLHDAVVKKLKPVTEESFREIVAQADSVRPRKGKGKAVKSAEA